MKVSVSIPADDPQVLDAYVAEHELVSRSAGLHMAIAALRDAAVEREAEQAITEWYESGEGDVWEVTLGDGLEIDASR